MPVRLALPALRLSLLFLMLVGAPPARAQQVDAGLAGQLQLAESYLRAAQYERATRILEDLHAAHPEIAIFYDRLKEAYEASKRYPDAINLVQQRLERSGDRVDLMAEKARLHYLNNEEAVAFALWDQALSKAGADRNAYRAIQESQFSAKLYDKAIITLEKARQAIGPQAMVEGELGYLYNLNGQHDKAMQAYLDLLGATPRQVAFVRNRLSRFVEQEEAVNASIAVAERAVRTTPLNRAYREILAWLYMEAKAYDKAFETYRAIDRLEKESGRVLYAFAQAVADEEAYDLALQAYEEILERYPDSPASADVLFGLAGMHEKWAAKINERATDEKGGRLDAPHYTKALEAYQSYIQRYPNGGAVGEAYRRIGALQRDVFFALDAAEAALKQSLRMPSNNLTLSDQAEFDLGRIAIMRGQLEDARIVFTRLLERLRTGELAEAARYELATIHFYQGEIEAARTLSEVLDENTSTDVANDAIELRVLLVENPGPDSVNTPLRLFAHAHLLGRQHQYTGALATLDSLVSAFASHPLADDSRYLRGLTLRQAGRFSDAAAAFGEVVSMFPTSYLADRSLFQYAQILDYDLREPEKAIEAYTRLLTEYPGSLFSSETRSRIRVLRGERVS